MLGYFRGDGDGSKAGPGRVSPMVGQRQRGKVSKWWEQTGPSVAKEGAHKGRPSEAGRFSDKLSSRRDRSEGK